MENFAPPTVNPISDAAADGCSICLEHLHRDFLDFCEMGVYDVSWSWDLLFFQGFLVRLLAQCRILVEVFELLCVVGVGLEEWHSSGCGCCLVDDFGASFTGLNEEESSVLLLSAADVLGSSVFSCRWRLFCESPGLGDPDPSFILWFMGNGCKNSKVVQSRKMVEK